MIYFDVEDLLLIAQEVIGGKPVVRELGLLGASAARPQTIAFGFEPYPTVAEKAAALLLSIALNHALLDGNKRLALAAALVFCSVNTGREPVMTNDEAYDLVIAVVEHQIDVPEVAEVFRRAGVTE